MSEMKNQEASEARLVLPRIANVFHVPGAPEGATRATLIALEAEAIRFRVIALNEHDVPDLGWDQFAGLDQNVQWPVVEISSTLDFDYVPLDVWSGHQPEKIIEWGQKMVTIEEEEIEDAAKFILHAMGSNLEESNQVANVRRAVEAEKMVERCLDPNSTLPTAATSLLPIHRLVVSHRGNPQEVIADPQLEQALDAMLQNQQFGLSDGDGNPLITAREVVSFMRGTLAGQAELLAQDRVTAVASGAAKAAELGKEMHFGVEGHSKEDNARRLEAAQAVQAVLMRDGLDDPTEPFALTSVIEHGGNLSEVVNDPGLYEDLRENLNLPFVQAATVEEKSIDYLDRGTNQDYFDSVVSSLKLKEQYGTDKVLQKAMQAASFASSQHQFPVAHVAAGKGKTATTTRGSAPEQRQRQQPGLAR
ncbi:hypothetical protein AAFM46_16810 (plasmid) [Arthrobacter sp. TMP15]|uniref:hypothetical protein n=1 Tax=Arthrobacter sp. TMP15 TaxID=3140789 RepID=UPI0031BA62C0